MLADAESWMERALETREARLGADHPYLAFSLRQLAAILIEDERYNEAEVLLLRARDLNAAAWGHAADQCSCQTDDLLQQVHRALGREPDAPQAEVTEVAADGEPDAEQLAAEEIERLHEELNRLAKEGRVEEAKEQAETALALVEQLHGRSSLPYVAGLDRLAQLLRQQRQLDQAAELHQQRLAILEALVEGDDVRLAPVLADLFAIARDQKRVDDAEQLALREMTIRDGSGQNIKVARALEMLGSLLLTDRQVARAESYFTHAAERWEAFAGEDAPEIVRALTSSAKSQVRLGNLAEAEALLRELLERTAARRYPDTNQQIQILQALKDSLQKQGRAKAASEVGLELDRGAGAAPGLHAGRHHEGRAREAGRAREVAPPSATRAELVDDRPDPAPCLGREPARDELLHTVEIVLADSLGGRRTQVTLRDGECRGILAGQFVQPTAADLLERVGGR